MDPVTSFEDYKKYLRVQIEKNSHTPAYKGRLAEAAGCHRSLLSQVLGGTVHLTPDQGARLAEFWKLPPLEGEYFLCLLSRARAASPALKRQLARRMEEIRGARLNLTERLEASPVHLGEEENRYYRNWVGVAVHVLCSIPSFQSVSVMAEKLSVSPERVRETLSSLHAIGLVEKRGERWMASARNLHLSRESPLLATHHTNWRLRAIDAIEEARAGSLHYTAVHALSKADWEAVKQRLIEALRDTRKIVEPSAEEELVCVNCDAFVVGKSAPS
jgi:uncharacterized protein (TIGR02147 family)